MTDVSHVEKFKLAFKHASAQLDLHMILYTIEVFGDEWYDLASKKIITDTHVAAVMSEIPGGGKRREKPVEPPKPPPTISSSSSSSSSSSTSSTTITSSV